jgi:heterotetrameric sarcosine oxidase gamma subunit
VSETSSTAPAAASAPATVPIARSPIAAADPVVVAAGWEVSGARAAGTLTLTDCTPLTKVQLRAAAAEVSGVGFGRARRDPDGTLVIGSGPGEWLLIGPPGQAGVLAGRLAGQLGPGDAATWVDLTHGRALVRLTGPDARRVLARLCGVDLGDDITPDGSALRTSVAALATDVIRDDAASAGGGRGGNDNDNDNDNDKGKDTNSDANGDATDSGASYLLHCERSSGQYLFDALLKAGADFGIEIDGFRPPGI